MGSSYRSCAPAADADISRKQTRGMQNKTRGQVKFSWTDEISPVPLAGSAAVAAEVEGEAEQNPGSSLSRTS